MIMLTRPQKRYGSGVMKRVVLYGSDGVGLALGR